jgi:hypothetical protein
MKMQTIVCRLGPSPQERECEESHTCPDLLLMRNGDVVGIGTTAGPEIRDQFPALHAGVASYEEAVVIPAPVFRKAVEAYVNGLPLRDVLEMLWPRLRQAPRELFRKWVASVQRWIATWVAQHRTAALFV